LGLEKGFKDVEMGVSLLSTGVLYDARTSKTQTCLYNITIRYPQNTKVTNRPVNTTTVDYSEPQG
jgi:hypothetical protein